MMISSGRAAAILGMVRVVNGVLALVAPSWLLRRLGTHTDDGSAIYPLRLFGVRTVLIGADLLLLRGSEQRRVARWGIMIHASDLASAVLASLTGQLPRRPAALAAAISTCNTALAVAAAHQPQTTEPADQD